MSATRRFAPAAIALSLATFAPIAGHAQAVASAARPAAATPVAVIAPAATITRAIVVPEGTEFSVVTAEAVSSKTATEGDRVALKVEEDVIVNGVVVIARGASVRGSVASAERAGRMGKGGKLNLRVDGTTAVDGQRLALRASKARSGNDAMGSTVALTVIFGPIGLLKKGKDASYPEGTRITVYTDQALTVAPATAP